jgi:hypothetical protein
MRKRPKALEAKSAHLTVMRGGQVQSAVKIQNYHIPVHAL